LDDSAGHGMLTAQRLDSENSRAKT